MKRDDIAKAEKIESHLSNLETGLAYWRNLTCIEVSGRDGVHRLEVADYPEPSEIGQAFSSIRSAVVGYYESRVHQVRAELGKLGVQF